VQSIAQKEQEYLELQDDFETLKAQKSLSQSVLEAYAETDIKIDVEFIPAKKNPITKQETPERVMMKKSDYDSVIKQLVTKNWVIKALEEIKRTGTKLTREFNQRRRVAELQERANSAEIEARAAEVNLANAKAEIADLQQQAWEQQEWMESQVTRNGKSIWEYFMDFITKQHEREYIERDER
jgi:hypothetical protein